MSRNNWPDDKLFFRLLNNKSNRTYWDNIDELRKRGSKNVYDKCLKYINSNVEKRKIIGIDVLAQLNTPDTVKPYSKQIVKLFVELLQFEKSPKVLLSILYGIGHNNENLNSDEQISLISKFKNNKNDCVREGTVFALLGIENKIAIDTLVFLTNDKMSYVRNWATFGIGTQVDTSNKKICDALWKRVDDKHQETKLEAIVGLAKRKDLKIDKIIEKEIRNEEFGSLLFEAIEETNNANFLPSLEQLLNKSKDDPEINSEWINDLKQCILVLKEQ